MTWSRRTWGVAVMVGVLGVLGYLYVAIFAAPDWAADRVRSANAAAQAAARESERGSVRTSMLAALAGAIAAFGAVYTARTFALNQRGQITERFTRAIDQLGQADKLAVRLGGIYALERIAGESAADHRAIVFVLAAYTRENSRWPPAEPSPASDPPEAAEDIKAIVAVLRRRKVGRERRDPIQLGLEHTNLCGSRGHGIHLINADLSGTQLQRADLGRAHLEGANLKGANLKGANLKGANLKGANLQGADVRGANLRHADLTDANLHEAIAGLPGTKMETSWPVGFEPAGAAIILSEE